jgi:hypothetical protein
MKNVFKLLGIIAMVMIIGMTFIGCDNEDGCINDEGNCIIVTDANARVIVRISCSMPDCVTTRISADAQLGPNMVIRCNCD